MEKREKGTILVVDDQELNRTILCEIFQEEYHMIEAENGRQALEIIREKEDELSAVLLDIVMPEMDGFQVLESLRDFMKRVPVFLITAASSEAEVTARGYELGVMDIIGKPFVAHIAKRRINNIIELFSVRKGLKKKVQVQERALWRQTREIQDLNRAIIEALATAIEFRDCESGEHIHRIHNLTLFLLDHTEYGKDLTRHQRLEIAMAAIMHDVGKIAIPDAILNKADRLTEEEFEIMKSHTIRGCELLDQIKKIKETSLYEYAYDICRHHHERWDGSGYPDGISGDEISPWAQIVALADVYDAMTNKRIYKPACTHEEGIQKILNGECGAFNPKLMDALRELEGEIKFLMYKEDGKEMA